MGGAQPLAITMNGGAALCVEVDLQRIERRIATALPRRARRRSLDDALERLDAARRERPRAVDRPARQRRRGAARARAARRRGRRRDRPDERARSAQRLRARRADASSRPTCCARSDPDEYLRRVGESVLAHVAAIRELQAGGRRGVRLRQRAARRRARSTATPTRSPTPASCPAYIRPLFCEGKGPFRWVALSGDPADIARHRRGDPRAVRRPGAHPALDRARRASACAFQGLPARICWLGYGERHLAGLRFNEMVASGELRGADRDRARPPRRRLGRVAAARDRGDARRLGRGRRLADPQRAGQHRDRRELGLLPPRRRRRHGQVAARRPGVRGRRDAGGRRADPAHAARRPRDGDRAPRRRRLSGGDRRRATRLGVRIPMPIDPGDSAGRRNAAQVLRPPEDGLPYLRQPADSRLEPGLGGGARRARSRRSRTTTAPTGRSTRPAARSCPAFVDCHTHLPFAGWRAEEYELKVTGVPVRGDRARGRRDPGVGAGARRGARRRGASRRRASIAREMLADGHVRRSSASPATGSPWRGSCASCGSRASWPRTAPQRRVAVTALLAHAVPDGYDADGWMDEVAAMVPQAAASAQRARHLRRVGRVRATTHLRAHGRAGGRARAAPARARRAVRDAPLGAGRAGRGRAVGRPPGVPAPRRPRRRWPPPSARPCCCPAPS